MGDAEQIAARAVALWMLEQGYATGHGDTLDDLLSELASGAFERGCESGWADNMWSENSW